MRNAFKREYKVYSIDEQKNHNLEYVCYNELEAVKKRNEIAKKYGPLTKQKIEIGKRILHVYYNEEVVFNEKI